MAWDDDKSTAQDPDNPTADEQVTADEWDNHVADQKNHSTRHESGGTDEISLGALAGQIATGQLSDAAVTAAKIADNAVGVSELMDALGTSASNKIPGTTYFTNANVESLNANGIIRGRGSERKDASQYDGTDVDARLDAALTDASDDDVIYLEGGTYESDRTISKIIHFIGIGGDFGVHTQINGSWTLDSGGSQIQMCRLDGSITLNGNNSQIVNSASPSGTITVSDDETLIYGLSRGDVTFESGTSSGLVDASVNVTVTDNGTNSVGDIA